jgi:hypothetical protein
MEYLNKTYYDLRYEDYYTVTEVLKENNSTFLYLSYHKKKHLSYKENLTFVEYHIDKKQHLPARNWASYINIIK